MNFSLNNTNGTSKAQPKLKAWEIHDVVLKEIKFNEFKGKKDPNTTFQTMVIRFENADGYYEEQVWCPKEGDDVRPVYNDRESPSNLEKLKFLLAHLGEQLSPAKYEKFKGMGWNLPEEFPKLVNTFIEVMKPAIGKSTRLKLIGNKKGEACLPFFVNISKEGEAYFSNNFLGSKAFFTPYEMTTMEKYKNAKPTDISAVSSDDLDVATESDSADTDLNFEI